MSNLRFILPYFKKYFLRLLMGFACLIFCDIGQLIIPRLLGLAIDLLRLEGITDSDLWPSVLTIVGLAVAVALFRYIWRQAIFGFGRVVERELRSLLYRKLVYLSPRWHEKNLSGDLMALATNDIESVRLAVGFGLISVVDAVVMSCTSLAFMLHISPRLTLWAMAPMPVITLVTWFLGQRIYRLTLETQTLFGQLTEVVREQLSGLRIIRAMALTPLALKEVEKVSQTYVNRNIRLAVYSGTFFPFLNLMGNLGVALVLYFGGRETLWGSMSAGDFVAFISYMGLLIWPMMALGMMFSILQQGLASLKRLSGVFTAEEEKRTKTSVKEAPVNPVPLIEFQNLSFRYPTRQEEALKNIDLLLPPDQVTALIGPMGSGKSTLAALIPGLYQAPPRSLKISGRAVEDWPLDEMRALFGYVPQDGFMFSGTVFENLTFGKPETAEEEALAAAEIAGLTEDLNHFPDGLHTLVGERGLTLSGGQRQRLALARALVINPAFLIMDDTLSAVDAAVEERILKKLWASRRGRGALIISHRLSSLSGADRIVVLDQGRLAAQGTAEELLRYEGGYFQRLCYLTGIMGFNGLSEKNGDVPE